MNNAVEETCLRGAALLSVALLAACSDDGVRAGENEGVDAITSALMTDEPDQRIDGYRGVVSLTFTAGGNCTSANPCSCTGWMLSKNTVVTAAHCIAMQGSSVTGITIDYMRPGVGRDRINNPTDIVEARASSFYEGGNSVKDAFSNPLNPSENNAKHDIGFIKRPGGWPRTNYRDYLRVYTDQMDTLTSVYVYGMGNIWRTQFQLDPDDKLRFSHFQLDPGLFASDLVIWTEAGQTERLCAGDSGGPYVKKIDGLDLVAGVHHGTDREDSDFCPKPGGDQWGEKLTWSGSDDFDWLRSSSGAACDTFSPSGPGNNYARCFDLPLINDAPDREQQFGTKGNAMAIAFGAIL